MKNKIFILLFIFLIIPIVSANGLTLINQTHFNINKTINIPQNITFQLKNEEPFTFQDIDFEENNIISMNPINLSSGANTSITANIIATQDFSGIIKIKGFYQSNLGPQNATHNINVDFNEGLSICDFSIVKGDRVVWFNNITTSTGSIKLINADTQAEVTTINPNSSYTNIFDTPINFKYYFTRLGVKFTNTCTIAVLDTTGKINDPNLDAQLALDINIIFEPTNLSVTILNNNYTIDAGSSTQDILSIRNDGNNIARDIHLVGDWFSFSPNNFDLDPGESRNVGYTITPIITNTSQTNKNYNKTLTIIGNFETFNKDFNIFIPFLEISEDFFQDSKTLEELFKERLEFIKAYCNENPNTGDCSKILRSITESSSSQNTTDPDLEFKIAFIEFADRMEEALKQVLQDNIEVKQQSQDAVTIANQTSQSVKDVKKGQDDIEGGSLFLGLVVLGILLLGGLGFIYYQLSERKKRKRASVYY